MPILSVEPSVLDGAGSRLVDIGGTIGLTASTLSGALADCPGMCGDDPVGEAMGRSYDRTAHALLSALAEARNALVNLGDGVRVSAFNYSVAEAQSDISGRSQALPDPPGSSMITADSPPSAVGSGEGAPAGFGWVVKCIGMIWPTGDSEKLRLAAAAWIAAGNQLISLETDAAGQLAIVAGQQIPEGEAMAQAFGTSVSAATTIMVQCTGVAARLSSFAAKIDAVHAAIIDLLSRICDPLTGFKIVWEFLTGQDEEEIRQIAQDIKVVVDTFEAETASLMAELAPALATAESAVSSLGPLVAKEWSRFLHGTQVGMLADLDLRFLKGFGSSAVDLVKDGWKFGAVRAAIDPQGFYRDLGATADGLRPLVGAGGEGAPGVVESWKHLGKETVHWDLWKEDPAEAAGRSVFDVGSAIVPGGAAAKGVKGISAARQLAKDAAKDVAKAQGAAGPVTKGEATAVKAANQANAAGSPRALPAAERGAGGPTAVGSSGRPSDAKSPDTKRGTAEIVTAQADAPRAPAPDPLHSSQPSGDGWHRGDDYGHDPSYATAPLERNWSYGEYPSEIRPEIKSLIDDPDAPWGRQSNGELLTQSAYESLFNKVGPAGEQWQNWPPNGGAVEGTRVTYTSLQSLLRDFGNGDLGIPVDRIGKPDGEFLAIMVDGHAASFEQRSLPIYSLTQPYGQFILNGDLPAGWTVELSEVAPAFGRLGGGIQLIVLDSVGSAVPITELREMKLLR